MFRFPEGVDLMGRVASFRVSWLLRYSMQTTVHVLAPSIAYMCFVESLKFYFIQLQPPNSDNLDESTRQHIGEIYEQVGCPKARIRFCDSKFAFPYTLTTLINPALVLFSCRKPNNAQEEKELYAMAGHEAVHAKENHAVKSELAFFMFYEVAKMLMFPYAANHRFFPVSTISFLCALGAYAEVNKTLEYRADHVSAHTLGTQQILRTLFRRHAGCSDHSLCYPSFESREARLSL